MEAKAVVKEVSLVMEEGKDMVEEAIKQAMVEKAVQEPVQKEVQEGLVILSVLNWTTQ
jgi:hypothetical protein